MSKTRSFGPKQIVVVTGLLAIVVLAAAIAITGSTLVALNRSSNSTPPAISPEVQSLNQALERLDSQVLR